MLILLPPSEGKTAPAGGPALDLSTLAFPELTDRRERLVGLLTKVSSGRPATALKALGLSAGQADELVRNAALREAPSARASDVYTGVLFEHLRLNELAAAARGHVLIASALWGVVTPDDRIPAYRLSMGAKLPRIAGLPAYWRAALRKALPDSGLVVDMRSGPYASAWTPSEADVVGVRAFIERGGKRTAVSHMVKATRGEVARLLLEAPAPATSPDQVADVVAAAGREVDLHRDGKGWALDVIERP